MLTLYNAFHINVVKFVFAYIRDYKCIEDRKDKFDHTSIPDQNKQSSEVLRYGSIVRTFTTCKCSNEASFYQILSVLSDHSIPLTLSVL